MKPLRRSYLLSGFFILTVFSTACASLRSRQAVPPPTGLLAQPTSGIAEQVEPTPLQTAALGEIPPTGMPTDGEVAVSGNQPGEGHLSRILSAQRPYKFGIVLGMEDPFFATLLHGARQSAVNQGIELFIQVPQTWNRDAQAQELGVLLARGDLDAILISPVDVQSMLPMLQKPAEAGIPIVTLQTSLVQDPLVSPIVFITTDNYQGGHLACQALVEVIRMKDDERGNLPSADQLIYLQKGISDYQDMDARAKGCTDYLSQQTDFLLAGTDWREGDSDSASQQIAAILTQTPGLKAIVCLDMVCAKSASQTLKSMGLVGQVSIAAFEATPEAVALLRAGEIDILATPKPADMGYLAVAMAAAGLDGVTSLPTSLQSGWTILTRQDLDSPASTPWIYYAHTEDVITANLQPTTRDLQVAFVAGIVDPFYVVMARGAGLAAENLGVHLLSFYPQDWSVTEQTTLLEELRANGELDALLLVPTDPLALEPSLKGMQASGIPTLFLDTALDTSMVPLSTLASDMQAGGYYTCRFLAETMNGKGKVYIQNVTPGIPTTDARERGCQLAFLEFPEITLVAVNYNDDDPAKAQAQLTTVLQNHPDLSAVFCTNVIGAQVVGQHLASQGLSGKVKVAAFDATAGTIDLLRNGVIDLVTAQKPADMGYLGVLFAVAALDGVANLPARISTDYVILTRENLDDPFYTQYFYTNDLP